MRDERSGFDEKLETILKASARIFADKGYHQASIRDIARETGISLSGLYYYFSSKDELLFLIQDHAFGTLEANVDRLLQGVTDPHRKLRLFLENYLRYFVNNMAEMKVLSHEAESLTGELHERVSARKRRLVDRAMEIVAELNPGNGIDLRVATFALFGMVNWIYNWYRPGRDVPVEKVAEDMSRLFLGGFLQDGSQVPAGAREAAPGDRHPSIWRLPSEG